MLHRKETQRNLLKENTTLRSIIQSEFEDEYKKLVEENSIIESKLQDLEAEISFKDKHIMNEREKGKKLEEEYLHNEKQLENKVMKKTKLIDDQQSKLSDRERQLNELKRLEHENTAESNKKDRIDMKNLASEFEKLNKQKQRIEDQARHLALKSYQTETTSAEIEEKIYSRLYMRLSEDLMLKMEIAESSLSDSDSKGDKLKAMNHTNIGVINSESGNAGYHSAHNSVNQDVPRCIIRPEQLEAALLEVHSGKVMKEVQNLNKEKSGNDEGQWRRVSN
ncbi:hypothetical protein HHI36_016252 [Cryptolaemus montrouzieri]|uniref:Cilia- and flagella-associated protein 157 n=1 Tax=Cryptolaemus montrouzieri TaxID=559131 RepID=A0ABD2NJ58_9CUCU